MRDLNVYLHETYGLDETNYWKTRDNKWIVKHSALEKIANIRGFTVVDEIVRHVPLRDGEIFVYCCVSVKGELEDKILTYTERADAWHKNLKSAISKENPSIMAFKRAYDRAVIKLLGFSDTYSEEESYDFKREQVKPPVHKLKGEKDG